VLFSTHILSDVERVADTVAVIDAGRVARQGPIAEVKSGYGASRRLLVQVTGGAAATARLADTLRGQPWAARVDIVEIEGHPACEVAADDLDAAGEVVPRLLADAGLGLARFEPRETRLEDALHRADRGGPMSPGAHAVATFARKELQEFLRGWRA
jgi:ABC-2 type transport system ATP-binding protein